VQICVRELMSDPQLREEKEQVEQLVRERFDEGDFRVARN